MTLDFLDSMSFRTLSAVLRGNWLIDKRWAESHLPLVAALLQGKPLSLDRKDYGAYDDDDYVPKQGSTEAEERYWLLAAVPQGGTYKVGRYTSFDQMPEGSIAVIPVTGPIMKYGGDCGEPGSTHMTQWVKSADASQNISAIIVMIDSPGGMVDGTATLAQAIKECSKPTIGFIDDGMMASAATWIGTSCDEVYASRKTDSIGSIGVLCTIADFSGWFEKEGIKLHEIYAPQSTEKNLDYKEALKGKYDLVEADLKYICSEFIRTVRQNRKSKLNTSESDPFHGAMYFAPDAEKIGLIDGIMSFDELVSYVKKKVSTSSGKKSSASADSNKNQQSTNTMENPFAKKFPVLTSLKGKEGKDITSADVDKANAELLVNDITGIAFVTEASIEANENELSTLRGQVASLTSEKETLTTQNKTLQDRVTELEAEDGDKAVTTPKDKDKTGDKAVKVDEMPHIKQMQQVVGTKTVEEPAAK